MEKLTRIMCLLACATVFTLASAKADTTITVNPADPWVGFMNVFNKPQDGGAYQFGSSWGTVDLTAVFSGTTLTLGPNTIGDPAAYWYTPAGGPGAVGNKTMDANMYVEPVGSLPGETVTFTGDVLASSLLGQVNALGNGWTAVAFVKDFAANYSSSVSSTVALTPGVFSVSLATIADPARHVQYGFEVIGPDVWATDVGNFGNIQIAPIPEPSSIALALTGLLGFVTVLRKRRV